MTVRFFAISVLLAGAALAQTATTPVQGTTPGPRGRGPNPGFARGAGWGGRGELLGLNSEARLTKQFGLDATQQNTLHTTILSAQVQQKGMREKETTLRTQLATAVKAGNESGIESAASELEALHQQQTSIRGKALAKVYTSLTPAQQAKFLPLMNRELGVAGPGPGGRGPRSAKGAPAVATPQQ